jgi:hypothetical protein
MAQRDYKAFLQGMLTGFLTEEDPVKSILEWLLRELMKIEAEAKVGAPKGKHSKERKTYFSGPQGAEAGHSSRDDISIGAEGKKRWLCAVFCDGEEAVRGGVIESGSGSFCEWGLNQEDRAAGQELRDRGHLGFAGIGDNQGVR